MDKKQLDWVSYIAAIAVLFLTLAGKPTMVAAIFKLF